VGVGIEAMSGVDTPRRVNESFEKRKVFMYSKEGEGRKRRAGKE